jgi:hypothetical protein
MMASVASVIVLSLLRKQSESALMEVAIELLNFSKDSCLQPKNLFFQIGFSAFGQYGVLR